MHGKSGRALPASLRAPYWEKAPVSDDKYPRDMVGYGRNPPDPRWPGGAQIAVQFVLNYEEGGENCILHGDAASEAFLSEIVGAQPLPGVRNMNMESIYEYGSRAGFWRLWRMFGERGMPLTVYAVAMALERNREAAAAMQEAGWEIASHGLRWIDYQYVDIDVERRHMEEAIRIHARGDRRAPAGLVHRPNQPEHAATSRQRKAIFFILPIVMPTICPTG